MALISALALIARIGTSVMMVRKISSAVASRQVRGALALFVPALCSPVLSDVGSELTENKRISAFLVSASVRLASLLCWDCWPCSVRWIAGLVQFA
ncbi:hypothetical protein ACN4EA_08605 [Corynebacterium macclintockiae]